MTTQTCLFGSRDRCHWCLVRKKPIADFCSNECAAAWQNAHPLDEGWRETAWSVPGGKYRQL